MNRRRPMVLSASFFRRVSPFETLRQSGQCHDTPRGVPLEPASRSEKGRPSGTRSGRPSSLDDLLPRFQYQVERRLRRPPEPREASLREYPREPRFAGLGPERETNVLRK